MFFSDGCRIRGSAAASVDRKLGNAEYGDFVSVFLCISPSQQEEEIFWHLVGESFLMPARRSSAGNGIATVCITETLDIELQKQGSCKARQYFYESIMLSMCQIKRRALQ